MITRRSLLALLGPVVAIALLLAVPAAAGDFEQRAEKFIVSLAQQAIDSLAKPGVQRGERIKRFRVMFNDHFAVHAIGRFVLGRHWQQATDKEQAEYLALFEDLMVVSYVDRFRKYAGENLRVVKSRIEGDSTATVFTEIVRPDIGQAVQVIWRIGAKGDMLKILDVLVEGTSLSQTLRADFGSIIRQREGKVAALIHELRLKTAELKLPDKN
ncbi:MAG TPA: ABC transporter substrate-binding protein [Rhodospirillales bacterium]|jgi:phospholipid transport system substrate-binding protein